MMRGLQNNGAFGYPYTLDAEGRYVYEKTVGIGAYGVVIAARDTKNNVLVAIKLIQRGKKLNVEQMRREIRNHRGLDHHHVVKFKQLILTPTHLGIVMEYLEKGNLKQYLQRLDGVSEKLARFLFQQLVVAVDYCHRMNVVNRDIKLENLLVTGNNTDWPMLKLCDFGFSKNKIMDSAEVSVVGTIQLVAPELLTLEQGETYDGRKADIWCIGLVLYTLVTGRYAFARSGENPTASDTVQKTVERIRNVEYQIPDYVSPQCADLIRKILVRNPAERPTIEEVQNHVYFLTSLPQGAVEMNHNLRHQLSFQSDDEIDFILTKAILDETYGQ